MKSNIIKEEPKIPVPSSIWRTRSKDFVAKESRFKKNNKESEKNIGKEGLTNIERKSSEIDKLKHNDKSDMNSRMDMLYQVKNMDERLQKWEPFMTESNMSPSHSHVDYELYKL